MNLLKTTMNGSHIGVAIRPRRWLSLLVAVSWCLGASRTSADLLELPPFTPDPVQLQYLQRSLALLNSGTPEYKPTFRLLLYGNSHMTMPWWLEFTAELKAAYPHVHFEVVNRAMVAFEPKLLRLTASSDIGPWQPDLVVVTTSFGAFGDPELGERNDYIPFFARLRELSTSDVLVFPSHILYATELSEPSEPIDDPELNPWYPGQDPWYTVYYMLFPKWANASGHCWANIRTPWKQYLINHNLPPNALLRDDNFHVNDDGGEFIKTLLKSFLIPEKRPAAMDPWNNARVRTAVVGSDIQWVGNALDLRFVGNRVDVVYEPAPAADAPEFRYTVDGRDPKDLPELYGFDRSSSSYGVIYPMPGVLEALSEALLLEETWKLRVTSLDPSSTEVRYTITGSKTGPDGSGSSLTPFVSQSRRIRLDPGALTIWWAYSVTQKMPPEDFDIEWNAVRRSVSTFTPLPEPTSGMESVETLFLGTADSVEHRLRIEPLAGTAKGIRALRVYSPAGAARISGSSTSLRAVLVGDALVVSWPETSGRGSLETARPDPGMNDWARVPETPVLEGGRYRVTLPIRTTAAVYRWRE